MKNLIAYIVGDFVVGEVIFVGEFLKEVGDFVERGFNRRGGEFVGDGFYRGEFFR